MEQVLNNVDVAAQTGVVQRRAVPFVAQVHLEFFLLYEVAGRNEVKSKSPQSKVRFKTKSGANNLTALSPNRRDGSSGTAPDFQTFPGSFL